MNWVLVNSIEIESPPEAVFAYASEMLNELEWNPHALSMESLTEGPPRAGSRYRARWTGSGESVVEFTEFVSGERWSAHATGAGVDIAVTGHVAAQGGGSKLTITMDLRPKGLLNLALPLLAIGMQRTERRNLPNLKRAIEARNSEREVNSGKVAETT